MCVHNVGIRMMEMSWFSGSGHYYYYLSPTQQASMNFQNICRYRFWSISTTTIAINNETEMNNRQLHRHSTEKLAQDNISTAYHFYYFLSGPNAVVVGSTDFFFRLFVYFLFFFRAWQREPSSNARELHSLFCLLSSVFISYVAKQRYMVLF